MATPSDQDKPPSIVLGVPGLWKDRTHFLHSVIESSDFLFAGNVLFHPPTKRGLVVDMYEHDPRLQEAFAIAGGGRIPPADLEAIGRHTMTPYLIGPGGSLENAKFMVQAAAAILKAGGIAVKIESTGVAHPRDRWLKLVDQELVVHGIDSFVVFLDGKGDFYSCGMHNLGFRDALFVSPPPDALEQLRLFLFYSQNPKQPLSDRNTVTLGSIKYRMHATPCDTFPADSPFHNPYGLWTLARV